MAKQDLLIDPPNEIEFTGPFDEVSISELILTNVTKKRIHFKIKTNQPNKYSIRPPKGTIAPDEIIIILISLLPNKYNPKEKRRHKIMVQYMDAPLHEATPLESWENACVNDITERKLKCVFHDDVDQISFSDLSLASTLHQLSFHTISFPHLEVLCGQTLETEISPCRPPQNKEHKYKHFNKSYSGSIMTPDQEQENSNFLWKFCFGLFILYLLNESLKN
ncbi:vesicle-associated membrane protein/synaptobrevin-binding protein-like isoform X1 [Centruroides vittatus]|uniref:vesicle-associated membrane protein/synaptobrevin-binding protein-like isoform X1 n=1 Tax=Centruroides vittatus TaxID=120091 RepID=UPI00350EBD3D